MCVCVCLCLCALCGRTREEEDFPDEGNEVNHRRAGTVHLVCQEREQLFHQKHERAEGGG